MAPEDGSCSSNREAGAVRLIEFRKTARRCTMDKITRNFLTAQYEEGMAFAASSDRVDLIPQGESPVQRYIANFSSRGLVRRGGEVVEADSFKVGIQFPTDYLRYVLPGEVVMCLSPGVFHPNVNGPFVCLGDIPPGTGLVDLLYQTYELIGFSKVTMDERDALNPVACRWARQNQDRFPIENRPLKRLERTPRLERTARLKRPESSERTERKVERPVPALSVRRLEQ
jgi:hypothetical protein